MRLGLNLRILLRMTRAQRIEEEIAKLPPEEVIELARWISELDASLWDKQMEADAASGRLDKLWKQAEKGIAAGDAKPLDELLDNP